MPQAADHITLGFSERATFFRVLSLLFDSGLCLVPALETVSQSSPEHSDFAQLSLELCKLLEKGYSLHNAMAIYPGAFSVFETHMVQIGSETGSMSEVLRRLADLTERNHSTSQKLKSALIYPSFLLVGCLLSALLVPPLLFNGLFEFVSSLNIELPMITRVVAGFSRMVSSGPFLAGFTIACVAAFVFLRGLSRDPSQRRRAYTMLYHFPPFSHVIRSLALVRFSFGLALMLDSGYPLHQALPLTIKSTDDPYFEFKGSPSVQDLHDGSDLSYALEKISLFPVLLIQAVRVGEETGSLGAVLYRVAEMMEEELQTRVDAAVAFLEPVALMLMGVLVGISAVAALLPLSKIVQTL